MTDASTPSRNWHESISQKLYECAGIRPYYADANTIIINADCRDVLPELPPVDLVLTDPPYNVGVAYDEHDDRMDSATYEAWCAEWFALCRAVAKRVIVFPGHGNLETWHAIRKPSGIGCWYKPGNPASGGVFQWCEWEPFLLYGKGMGGSDVIRATVSKQRDTGDHPCPKPIQLFKTIVERSKAGTILDPFLESGTTIVAARQLGVRAIGIEKSERYCEIAVRRLQQAVLPLEIPA